jgi:hypothetical protein
MTESLRLAPYPDNQARARDIERGAQEPVEELLADMRAARSRYDDAVATMPPSGWTATVRTA